MKYIQAFLIMMFLAIQALGQDIPTIDWAELQKTKPWEKTEVWEPQPKVVNPGLEGQAPSDAIILFDGSDLSNWQKPQFNFEGINMEQVAAVIANLDPKHEHAPADWTIENGELVVGPGKGPIETKYEFGDMQLHIEWVSPVDEGKEGQAYSNSGIFLMHFYELQVLNNYENKTYANGQAGSIYKQHPPLVNVSRKPGEWQKYDVIFIAPRFKEDGSVESPAKVTVFHNGVLVQNSTEPKGPTAYIGEPYYVAHPDKLSFKLQDHGDKVRFKNIWVREL